MLTRQELNRLRFLYKRLKGEHKEYREIIDFFKERYFLKEKHIFEIAYIYDKNYQPDGDFTKVTDPIRMSYKDYMDLPSEVLALMEFTDDFRPENYEISSGNGLYEIEHDGTTYFLFDDWRDVERMAFMSANFLCDDPETILPYIYITDTDRHLICGDESDNYVENLSNDDIIELADLKDQIDEINEDAEKIESLKEEIKEKEEELDDLDVDLENYEELKSEIEQKISELQDELDDLPVQDVDKEIDELIYEASGKLRDQVYDRVWAELADPVDYFIGNGYYENIGDLIRYAPVSFDCDRVKSDYINDEDEDSVASLIGWNFEEEIKLKDMGRFYIFTEQ